MANTAADVSPRSLAAFCIMVVATMPPASGGKPVITSALSMKSGQTTQARPHIPAKPARQITTVFHCSSKRLRLKSVPIWAISKKMATELPTGSSFESATTVFGRNVQKQHRIMTAEIKTEGIQPLVSFASHSPNRMMTKQATKADMKLYAIVIAIFSSSSIRRLSAGMSGSPLTNKMRCSACLAF